MKHFNMKSLALGVALLGSFFAGSEVRAQEYLTNPNDVTVGYYYIVSSANPEYAWTVLPTKEMAIAKLDTSKPEFVWFVEGRNGTGDVSAIGTKITDQGSAYRLRFCFGKPEWTDHTSKSTLEGGEGPFYSMGGLNENADKQLFTIDTEWGMHNWQDVNAEGFRFSASNRGYNVAPQNGMFGNGVKLWFYGNNTYNDEGRWKLLPVEGDALEALNAIEDAEEYVKNLPAYALDGLVNDCVALVAELKQMKENEGTAEGQYNVTRPALGADWAIWSNLDDYDEPTDTYYVENADNEEALTNWKARLEALVEKVRATLVERMLGLDPVNIITLQWNGAGRYSGINGGGKWENPSDFGSPNGGNGRIGLIQSDGDRYFIASQAMFMKITEDGKRVTADSRDDATAFITTRTSDNGLTFMTEDGWYLTGSQFNPSKTKPTQDYKINTFGNYANISANDGARELNGVYYSSMIFPFTIGNPDKEGYNTFILKTDGTSVTAEKVDVVPAGTPFLYVAASADDNVRLPIPQTDQAYEENIQSDGNLLNGAFIARVEGDELKALVPTIYSISVQDGNVGYYLGGGFKENTPANCAYITQDAAEALGAAQFVLQYDKDNATVEVLLTDPVVSAIADAIAKFKELKEVAQRVGKIYSYELTDFDNDLLNTAYDEEATYDGMGLSEVNGLKDQFQALIDAIKETLMLGLDPVNIVTLQWNGAGRYSGINGGGKWEKPSDFGSPNGGNGRIGLIQKEDDKFYIASQGLFLKIVGGERVTAENKDDATAFITTRTSDNGLTFMTEDGMYLTGSQFTPSYEQPTQDYKINTFNNYANVSVADPATELNGIFYSSLAIPFKVQKPDNAAYHTFILRSDGIGITAEDVDVVPAGVPFLYVGPSKGDEARMPIPQEDQEYVEAINIDANLLDGGFLARMEGDELEFLIPEIYTLSVKDDQVGYFLGGGFTENTPANRAYITQETADALGTDQFVLNYNAEEGTLEVTINNPLGTAIAEAIAKFKELNDLVTDATVTNPDRYTYELTEEDNALLDGAYDEAETYEGKSLEEVMALKAQFQALIDAIKATRSLGLKDVNIVTLQWNGAGRYTGLNGRSSWSDPSDFGMPNGGNGKLGIIKKENGYVIASQGVFYKILEDGTKGNAEGEDDATQFTVTGSVEDGLTFEFEGKYLTGAQLDITEEQPEQNYKVNTFDVDNQHYAKANEDLIQVGDVYMAAIALPFKVQKPEGEGFHTYVVKKTDGDITTEEVDVVDAGVPFIYVSPTNDGEERRLLIPQDDQAYVAVPSTETLLSGFYLPSDAPKGVFKFGVDAENEGVAGFFEGDPEGADKGYIAAEVAEELNAAKFLFEDGQLKAYDADGNEIVTGITETTFIRVDTNAIYNLNGVRVVNPTKGVYIQNGKKVVVK